MVIQARWRRRDQSEFVKDRAGREYEIATFEGGKGPLDRFAPRRAIQDFGTRLRASVFLKGGPLQFTVDADASLSQIDEAVDAIRQEARHLLESGRWEPGGSYYLPKESAP